MPPSCQVGNAEAGLRDEQLRSSRLRGECEALLMSREDGAAGAGAGLQQALSKLAAKEAECTMLEVRENTSAACMGPVLYAPSSFPQAQLEATTMLIEALDRELSKLRQQVGGIAKIGTTLPDTYASP